MTDDGWTFWGVGQVADKPQWAVGRQIHVFHELIILSGGKMHVRVGGQAYSAGPGDALFYRAGVEHEERSDADDPVDMRHIGFRADLPKHLPVMQHDAQGRLRQLVRWLDEEWSSAEPVARTLGQWLWRTIVWEWQRLALHREEPLVEAVRGYIRRHIDDDVTLETLADSVGLSKFHFSRRFHELTGQTPMAYVRAQRIAHAQYLITKTDLPLKAIPAQAGLGDQYQMCRLFKRHLGATPGAIRAAVQRQRRISQGRS